ncbi:MAG: hypothetical protein Greene101449_657 [Candidatus Peregrinibacteria bacterium Greene1014_49]|nr:MAG: hypothetical protein Greene101449_657 [Candidatus Peregrinibacteria bacterium Greene1014_49]
MSCMQTTRLILESPEQILPPSQSSPSLSSVILSPQRLIIHSCEPLLKGDGEVHMLHGGHPPPCDPASHSSIGTIPVVLLFRCEYCGATGSFGCLIPSPHFGSLQPFVQLSVSMLFPSSHCSPESRTLLPQEPPPEEPPEPPLP